MLTRKTGYLVAKPDEDVPEASRQLQSQGWVKLPGVFDAAAVRVIADEINGVFDTLEPDVRGTRAGVDHFRPFRYEMFNRSAASQAAKDAIPSESCTQVHPSQAWASTRSG